MIPIKEAISSGAWLHCEFTAKKEIFRLKVLSFRKLNLSEVDKPEEIELIDKNTIIWIMELEVINLTKEPIHPVDGPIQLILIDQDGFKFDVFFDSHLQFLSNFAKKSGMKRFFSDYLIPKILAVGAISFQLPDDNEAVYSISVKNGSINEA